MWMPIFWDMAQLHWDPTVLRQHCAIPHIQWSEFLDILTLEDQDTMSHQNTGISIPSDTMSYPRASESTELILLCQLG